MPWTVAGSTVVYECTSNWRPYLGCDVHRPVSRRLSPTCAPSSAPTTVIRSGPPRLAATRAMVYPVSSLTKVIRSSTASSTEPPAAESAATTRPMPILSRFPPVLYGHGHDLERGHCYFRGHRSGAGAAAAMARGPGPPAGGPHGLGTHHPRPLPAGTIPHRGRLRGQRTPTRRHSQGRGN